jgi:hypothetical protein
MSLIARLVAAALILLTLFAALLWSNALPRITPEQRRALDLMEAESGRADGQRNAFPMLWFLLQDVPAERIDALFAADLAEYQRLDALGDSAGFQSPSHAEFPPLRLDQSRLCQPRDVSCLEQVRADPDQARETVASLQPVLERLDALRTADHLRYALPSSYHSPLPALGGLGNLQALRNALLFAEGETDAALDATCSDFATWRRLRARTDMLIADMIGIAYGRMQLQLLAGMLAELPPEHPLPQACDQALAEPGEDEFDQCEAWRGEYRLARNLQLGTGPNDLAASLEKDGLAGSGLGALAINPKATVAYFAQDLARLCAAGESIPPFKPGLGDQLFNRMGVILHEIGRPGYESYRLRAQDFATLLQAARTVAWLRGQPDQAAGFTARPEGYRLYAESLELDPEGRRLVWSARERRSGEPESPALPLPGSALPGN